MQEADHLNESRNDQFYYGDEQDYSNAEEGEEEFNQRWL